MRGRVDPARLARRGPRRARVLSRAGRVSVGSSRESPPACMRSLAVVLALGAARNRILLRAPRARRPSGARGPRSRLGATTRDSGGRSSPRAARSIRMGDGTSPTPSTRGIPRARGDETSGSQRPTILFTGESMMVGEGLTWDESVPAQVGDDLGRAEREPRRPRVRHRPGIPAIEGRAPALSHAGRPRFRCSPRTVRSKPGLRSGRTSGQGWPGQPAVTPTATYSRSCV